VVLRASTFGGVLVVGIYTIIMMAFTDSNRFDWFKTFVDFLLTKKAGKNMWIAHFLTNQIPAHKKKTSKNCSARNDLKILKYGHNHYINSLSMLDH